MRVIIAARLSRKQANGEQGIGIDTQDKRARENAEREGHEVVAMVADTKSGTVPPWDRKNLKPWVTDPARLARYDAILAYKTDRWSRGTQEDFTRIENWATEHGKKLIIVDGPQYPARDDSDYWRWAAEKRAARAEWEACRERSMRAQRELRERGKLVGRAAFGYESAGEKYNKTIIPTDQGRRLVPQAYDRIIKGESLAKVALWLAAETGRPWTRNMVSKLIKNPTYKGRRCVWDERTRTYGKTLFKCEALVLADIWQKANDNLKARPGRGKRSTTINEPALLTSVLRCRKCDGPMYKCYVGKEPHRMAYYRCVGKGAVPRSTCKNMIQVVMIDKLVSELMAELDEPIMEPREIRGHNHDAEIQEKRDEITDATRTMQGAEMIAEITRLQAEIDALASLPAVADTWEEVDTGETYAGQWARLETAERGAWMRSSGIKVFAERVAERGEDCMTLLGKGALGQAEEIQKGDVRVLVTWNLNALKAA